MKKHKFVQGCSQVLSHKSVRESFFVVRCMDGAYYFMGNCTTEWTFGGSRLKEIQGKTYFSVDKTIGKRWQDESEVE